MRSAQDFLKAAKKITIVIADLYELMNSIPFFPWTSYNFLLLKIKGNLPFKTVKLLDPKVSNRLKLVNELFS